MKEERKDVINIIKEFRNLTPEQFRELFLEPLLKTKKYLRKEIFRLWQKTIREPKGFELPKGWGVYIHNFGGIEKAYFYGLYAASDPSFTFGNSRKLPIKKPFNIPVNISDEKKGYFWFMIGCLTFEGLKKLNNEISSCKQISKGRLEKIFEEFRVKNLYMILNTQADIETIKNILQDIFMEATGDRMSDIKFLLKAYFILLYYWKKINEKGMERFLQEEEPLLTEMFQFPCAAYQFWGQSDYAIVELLRSLIEDFKISLLATKYFKPCHGCGSIFWKKLNRKYCSEKCANRVRDRIKQLKRTEKNIPLKYHL